jgi:RNase P subunit RPR2
MKADPKTLKKRPRGVYHTPTQCPACDAENAFETKRKSGVETLRGESLHIAYERQVCKNCGFTLLTVPQMEARVRLVVEAYQKKHGLLTATETRRRRLALGCKTQQELSDAAPNIAIATLKRLEAGQRVQDVATDCLLRKELRLLEEKQKRKLVQKFLQNPNWGFTHGAMTVNIDTFSYSRWDAVAMPTPERVCASC